MLLSLQILFWISVFGLVHSYVLYPLILKLWATGKKQNDNCYKTNDPLPYVSLIMAVYNEEIVIRDKMEAIRNLDYPKDKLLLYIGSDCSDDATNEILKGIEYSDLNLRFFAFADRRGKPHVVNDLASYCFKENGQVENHILLMTDASVMLQSDTLFQLVKHFKNPEIMLVDTNMINSAGQDKGISKLEKQYISSEVHLKHLESLAFGKMIGPFGGCYAVRSSHFSMIPDKFLVDDFYITMKAFEKGGNAINEMDAICFETLPDDMSEEYRRKRRISAGNFQNLYTFQHLLWKGNSLSFAFFSHKVLRWLGPFFIIFVGLSCLILALHGNIVYQILLVLMTIVLIVVPALDVLFKSLNINILPFRAVRYFVMMNTALLEGFINYLKGIRNNVWQPTNRK